MCDDKDLVKDEQPVGSVDYVDLLRQLTVVFADAFPLPSLDDDSALNLWGGKMLVDVVHLAKAFGGFNGLMTGVACLCDEADLCPSVMMSRKDNVAAMGVEGPVIDNIIKYLPQILAFIQAFSGFFKK